MSYTYRRKSKTPQIPVDLSICALCFGPQGEEEEYGKFFQSENQQLAVHQFCLFFASGLAQNGEDNEGFDGFLYDDIRMEIMRANKLKCTLCFKKGASVGCSVKKCKACFHFCCGLKKKALFQYFGTFCTFCRYHRPSQCKSLPNANQVCPICLCDINCIDGVNSLGSPCCKNAWFHRTCVQKQALASGSHFFRCAFCNNLEKFQKEMNRMGIYIPERDAVWEQGDAYNDLLHAYNKCDCSTCLCPKGREFSGEHDGSEWKIFLCFACGQSGTHLQCKGWSRLPPRWHCVDCDIVPVSTHTCISSLGFRRPQSVSSIPPVDQIQINDESAENQTSIPSGAHFGHDVERSSEVSIVDIITSCPTSHQSPSSTTSCTRIVGQRLSEFANIEGIVPAERQISAPSCVKKGNNLAERSSDLSTVNIMDSDGDTIENGSKHLSASRSCKYPRRVKDITSSKLLNHENSSATDSIDLNENPNCIILGETPEFAETTPSSSTLCSYEIEDSESLRIVNCAKSTATNCNPVEHLESGIEQNIESDTLDTVQNCTKADDLESLKSILTSISVSLDHDLPDNSSETSSIIPFQAPFCSDVSREDRTESSFLSGYNDETEHVKRPSKRRKQKNIYKTATKSQRRRVREKTERYLEDSKCKTTSDIQSNHGPTSSRKRCKRETSNKTSEESKLDGHNKNKKDSCLKSGKSMQHRTDHEKNSRRNCKNKTSHLQSEKPKLEYDNLVGKSSRHCIENNTGLKNKNSELYDHDVLPKRKRKKRTVVVEEFRAKLNRDSTSKLESHSDIYFSDTYPSKTESHDNSFSLSLDVTVDTSIDEEIQTKKDSSSQTPSKPRHKKLKAKRHKSAPQEKLQANSEASSQTSSKSSYKGLKSTLETPEVPSPNHLSTLSTGVPSPSKLHSKLKSSINHPKMSSPKKLSPLPGHLDLYSMFTSQKSTKRKVITSLKDDTENTQRYQKSPKMKRHLKRRKIDSSCHRSIASYMTSSSKSSSPEKNSREFSSNSFAQSSSSKNSPAHKLESNSCNSSFTLGTGTSIAKSSSRKKNPKEETLPSDANSTSSALPGFSQSCMQIARDIFSHAVKRLSGSFDRCESEHDFTEQVKQAALKSKRVEDSDNDSSQSVKVVKVVKKRDRFKTTCESKGDLHANVDHTKCIAVDRHSVDSNPIVIDDESDDQDSGKGGSRDNSDAATSYTSTTDIKDIDEETLDGFEDVTDEGVFLPAEEQSDFLDSNSNYKRNIQFTTDAIPTSKEVSEKDKKGKSRGKTKEKEETKTIEKRKRPKATALDSKQNYSSTDTTPTRNTPLSAKRKHQNKKSPVSLTLTDENSSDEGYTHEPLQKKQKSSLSPKSKVSLTEYTECSDEDFQSKTKRRKAFKLAICERSLRRTKKRCNDDNYIDFSSKDI